MWSKDKKRQTHKKPKQKILAEYIFLTHAQQKHMFFFIQDQESWCCDVMCSVPDTVRSTRKSIYCDWDGIHLFDLLYIDGSFCSRCGSTSFGRFVMLQLLEIPAAFMLFKSMNGHWASDAIHEVMESILFLVDPYFFPPNLFLFNGFLFDTKFKNYKNNSFFLTCHIFIE